MAEQVIKSKTGTPIPYTSGGKIYYKTVTATPTVSGTKVSTKTYSSGAAATKAERSSAVVSQTLQEDNKFYKVFTKTTGQGTNVKYLPKDQYTKTETSASITLDPTPRSGQEISDYKRLAAQTFERQGRPTSYTASGQLEVGIRGTDRKEIIGDERTLGGASVIATIPKSASATEQGIYGLSRQKSKQKAKLGDTYDAAQLFAKTGYKVETFEGGFTAEKGKEKITFKQGGVFTEKGYGGAKTGTASFQSLPIYEGDKKRVFTKTDKGVNVKYIYENMKPRTRYETFKQKHKEDIIGMKILPVLEQGVKKVKEDFKEGKEYRNEINKKVKNLLPSSKAYFESKEKIQTRPSIFSDFTGREEMIGTYKGTRKDVYIGAAGRAYSKIFGEVHPQPPAVVGVGGGTGTFTYTPKIKDEEREQKLGSLSYGIITGMYEGVRTKPIKTVAMLGVGYVSSAVVAPFVIGKSAQAIAKVAPYTFRAVTKGAIAGRAVVGATFKYGLPAAYVGYKAVQVAGEPDYEKKGRIIGESIATELLPSLIGARIGQRFGYKPVQRFAVEQELLLSATGSRAASSLAKPMTKIAGTAHKYKVPDKLLSSVEAPKSYGKGTGLKTEKFFTEKGRVVMGSISQQSDIGNAQWLEPSTIKVSYGKTTVYSGGRRIVKDTDLIPSRWESKAQLAARFKSATGKELDSHEFYESKIFPAHHGYQKVSVKSGGTTKKIKLGEQIYRKVLGTFTVRQGESAGKPELYRLGKDLPDTIFSVKRIADVGVSSRLNKPITAKDKSTLLDNIKKVETWEAPKVEKLINGRYEEVENPFTTMQPDYAVGLGKPKAEFKVPNWVDKVQSSMSSSSNAKTLILANRIKKSMTSPSDSMIRRVVLASPSTKTKSMLSGFSKSFSLSSMASPSVPVSLSVSGGYTSSSYKSPSPSSSFSPSLKSSPSLSP
ncbi:MAG: hypothetical protein KKC77_19255, partial [Proteobacteria bacterium]|nr:hypothetical protein [Pseudomonadota bacterium]